MKNSKKAKSANDIELAAKWKCDIRTIQRWRKAGAPLEDDAAQRSFLSLRRNLPSKTLAILADKRQSDMAAALADTADAASLAQGAANVLQRLCAMETRTFRALEKALTSGDALRIRAAREDWLKIGDALRRYDAAVEAERRVKGEFIPRASVERDIKTIVSLWAQFLGGRLTELCPRLVGINDPIEILRKLQGGNDLGNLPGILALRDTLATMTSKFCNLTETSKWFCATATSAISDFFANNNSGVDSLGNFGFHIFRLIAHCQTEPKSAALLEQFISALPDETLRAARIDFEKWSSQLDNQKGEFKK